MKQLIALGTMVIFASLAQASTYLRPQLAYLIPEESDADGAVGIFTALGYTPPSSPQHDLELEVGWAKWDFNESGTELGFNFTGSADLRILPLLANYRFNATLGKGTKAYLQIGAGFTRVSTDWSANIDGIGSLSGSDSSTEFTYGIGGGAAWRFGEKTSVHVGYRYLNVGSSAIEVDDETVDLGDQGAHVVEAGFTFRF